MSRYSIQYFSDIVRHHETSPVKHHPLTYQSLDEAEASALNEMEAVFAKFGTKAGYAILDGNRHVMAIGPGRSDDA